MELLTNCAEQTDPDTVTQLRVTETSPARSDRNVLLCKSASLKFSSEAGKGLPVRSTTKTTPTWLL